MESTRSAKTLRNFASSIFSHRILNTVLIGVGIYIGVTIIFGLLYYLFGALDFKSVSGPRTVHFLDYIYFSAVTFTTIGYGDILPKAGAGEVIVFFESCFELTFIPVFGGYLAYKFLQRPNDIILTDNFYIRYRNQKVYLSSRVGNKGKSLVDCTATIELIKIENNVKRTLYRREINVPMVEMTWYLEIRLDGKENALVCEQFRTLMTTPETSLIRITVVGFDSRTGNLVHLFKYYTMDKLLYGGKFLDVYTWEGIKRTNPEWANFNKVVSLSAPEKQIIADILKKEEFA